MSKRFFALAVCFVLMAQTVAYADIIMTPDNNDFFSRHQQDCVYSGRSYYANGDGGFVSVKTAPDTDTEMSKISNGTVIGIQFTYLHKGEQWGVVLDNRDPSGWVPMRQLVLVYDNTCFQEDHENELYEYKGDYDALKITEGEVVLWSWPGSGEEKGEMDEPSVKDYVACMEQSADGSEFPLAYQDEQGRCWLFINYWRGHRNVWVCLDDPLNRDIPAFHPVPEPAEQNSDTAHNESGTSDHFVITLIILLVAALVIGAIFLIKIFWKPSDTGGNRNE